MLDMSHLHYTQKAGLDAVVGAGLLAATTVADVTTFFGLISVILLVVLSSLRIYVTIKEIKDRKKTRNRRKDDHSGRRRED